MFICFASQLLLYFNIIEYLIFLLIVKIHFKIHLLNHLIIKSSVSVCLSMAELSKQLASPIYNNPQRTICSMLRFMTQHWTVWNTFMYHLCWFFSMVSMLDRIPGAGREDAGHVCVWLWPLLQAWYHRRGQTGHEHCGSGTADWGVERPG